MSGLGWGVRHIPCAAAHVRSLSNKNFINLKVSHQQGVAIATGKDTVSRHLHSATAT